MVITVHFHFSVVLIAFHFHFLLKSLTNITMVLLVSSCSSGRSRPVCLMEIDGGRLALAAHQCHHLHLYHHHHHHSHWPYHYWKEFSSESTELWIFNSKLNDIWYPYWCKCVAFIIKTLLYFLGSTEQISHLCKDLNHYKMKVSKKN